MGGELEENEETVMPDGVGEMGRARSCKVFLGSCKELAFILSPVGGHPPIAVWRIGW